MTKEGLKGAQIGSIGGLEGDNRDSKLGPDYTNSSGQFKGVPIFLFASYLCKYYP